MKKSLSENLVLFLFIGISIVFFFAGVDSGAVPFIIIALVLFTGTLLIGTNLASVDFDEQWLFVRKQGKTIKVPIHRIEWVTELVGSGMSTCFMGFKSPTIFGSRIMFLGFPYRKSLDQLVSIAKSQGNEIKVNGWLS